MNNFPIKICVYTFCYNNGRILPFIIDYWKSYATKVIVYDNMSTDNSLEILSKYSWIEVRSYNTDNQYNANKILEIKNNCYQEAKGKFDYVMVCDIDEVLYYNNELVNTLENYKKLNIKLFNSNYYNVISKDFPSYKSTEFLHSNLSAVLFKTTNKVLLFDPSLTITFNNYQNSYTLLESNIKSETIDILHLKMLGLQYYDENQLLLYSRISSDSNKQFALNYGANRILVKSLFNNIRLKTLYNNNPNIVTIKFGKCELPTKEIQVEELLLNVVKVEEYVAKNIEKIETKVQEPTIIKKEDTKKLEVKPVDSNKLFHGIKWNNPNIIKKSNVSNKSCAVVLPVYKTDLTDNEILSLKQVVKVLGKSYELFLVYPDNINPEYYNINGDYKFNLVACNKEFFKDTKTYSFLLETNKFYELFKDYSYMLIYQLDAWIFNDNLKKFIDMKYDYIGSPWKAGTFGSYFASVGNGGVSLRKISKFIEMTNAITENDKKMAKYIHSEDLYFCKDFKKLHPNITFTLSSVKEACEFSICADPKQFIEKNNKGRLPMCVHAWESYTYYWDNYIPVNKLELQKLEEIRKKKEELKKLLRDLLIVKYQNRILEEIQKKIEERELKKRERYEAAEKEKAELRKKQEEQKQRNRELYVEKKEEVKEVVLELVVELKVEIKKIVTLNETLEGLSIIIAAYNTANYIEETLDSILSLNWFKNHDNYEIIVGIDGCESTLKIMKTILNKYNNLILLKMDSNKGTFITANTLISVAKYNKILRFDSDDLFTTNNSITKIMEASKTADIIRYWYTDFSDNYNKLNRLCAYGSVLYDKLVFKKAGGYLDWKCSGDYEFFERVKNNFSVKELKESIYLHRIRQDSLMHAADTSMKSQYRKLLNEQVKKYNFKKGDNIYINPIINTYKIIELHYKYIFIIPNRGGQHINKLIKNINNLYNNCKIVIINQEDDNIFLKGLLYNIAYIYNKYNSEYYIFMDNDIILSKALNIEKYYNIFNLPYIGWNKISLIHYINENEYIIDSTDKNTYGWGALCIISNKDFEKSGGFSNLCSGWGREDDIYKIKTNTNKRINNTICHITHERRNLNNPECLKHNDNIYKLYVLKQILYMLDGYLDTTYNILYNNYETNVLYIGVNAINITKDFTYNNLYNNMKIAIDKDFKNYKVIK